MPPFGEGSRGRLNAVSCGRGRFAESASQQPCRSPGLDAGARRRPRADCARRPRWSGARPRAGWGGASALHRLRAKARVAWARGPAEPSRLIGRPITKPPMPCSAAMRTGAVHRRRISRASGSSNRRRWCASHRTGPGRWFWCPTSSPKQARADGQARQRILPTEESCRGPRRWPVVPVIAAFNPSCEYRGATRRSYTLLSPCRQIRPPRS